MSTYRVFRLHSAINLCPALGLVCFEARLQTTMFSELNLDSNKASIFRLKHSAPVHHDPSG
ncbi:hypothetical protein D3C85_810270 [compost metagenome]